MRQVQIASRTAEPVKGRRERSAGIARKAVLFALMHYRPFLSVVKVRRVRKESVTEIAFFNHYAKGMGFWIYVDSVA